MISRLHSFDDPVEIEEGMVFALETYCPASDGRSAARIEEEVLVTADGPRSSPASRPRSCSSPGASTSAAPTSSEGRHGDGASEPSARASIATGAGPTLELDTALALYRRMLLIRRFEDTVQSLFQKGEVHGTTHLYSGQEAVAVGVCSVLDAAGPRRRHLPRPRPRARARRRAAGAARRVARARDGRLRRPRRLDERHRSRARPDRLLRDRTR